ncbi:chaperone heat shock hsp12 protein [Rutstroemia sp. NJR-2017a BVV2]|nr:chaperone heat shock hsp12 protein [Rutstroemia sp. NJR-2017a BVV2]
MPILQYKKVTSLPLNTSFLLHSHQRLQSQSQSTTSKHFQPYHFSNNPSFKMSDALRKDNTDKLTDKLTPDSQKSTLEQASDKTSGLADKAAGAVQPSDSKSTTQKASDSVQGTTDDAQKQGQGVLGSVSDAAGNAANTVSDTLSNTANSLTGNNK